MTDIKFPEGLSIYPPSEKAPDFIKGDLVITNDFIAFYNANQKQGKLRMKLKLSKAGRLYAEVDTWEKPTTVPQVKEQIREILNPNITPQEQEILEQHRNEHNEKVGKQEIEYQEDDGIDASSIPF